MCVCVRFPVRVPVYVATYVYRRLTLKELSHGFVYALRHT